MRVYISADIEGITGIVSWSQCSRPDGGSYDFPFARRMMTHDVNAAIRGARRAGATEVLIKDSHGNSKNLLIDELEPGVELISGQGIGKTDGMMHGLDGSFDAAILVGYHARAGTAKGVMEHTITGGIHRLKLNDKEIGEIGLSAATAGEFNVPLVTISSDQAGCDETTMLVPNIQTAVVKTGFGRYAARLLSPEITGPIIEAAAFQGVSKRALIQPFKLEGSAKLEIEFNRSEETDMGEGFPGMDRTDGYTLAGKFDSFRLAHAAIWNLVELSFQGIGAQK